MERSFAGQGEHGRWWNNPTMVERLKLTDAQRKAMDDTLQQHRETLVDLRGSLEKAELELEPLMKEDQPNESAILAQIDKVAQARAELEKANARFLLAIRSKLTPEQWKQMQADRANRPRGAWGRNGQGSGNWQPGQRHREPPPDGQAPPPPAGPQSMMDGGMPQDGPPAPEQGAGGVE
jgi:Spy/CpxP family protein refolding chaperone